MATKNNKDNKNNNKFQDWNDNVYNNSPYQNGDYYVDKNKFDINYINQQNNNDYIDNNYYNSNENYTNNYNMNSDYNNYNENNDYNNDNYYNYYNNQYYSNPQDYNNQYYYNDNNYSSQFNGQHGDSNQNYNNDQYDDNSYYNDSNYQNNKRKKKNNYFKIFIRLLLSLIIIGATAFAGYYYMIYSSVKPYENVFAKGVSVDGIDLTGLSKDEGVKLVQDQANKKKNSWFVNLKYEGNLVVKINSNSVGINYHTNEALNNAWAIAKTGNIFQKSEELAKVEKSNLEFYSIQPETKMDNVNKILEQIKQNAYIPPSDAKFIKFDPNLSEPFVFQKEIIGRSIDIDSARVQINDLLQKMALGDVELIAIPLEPKIKVNDLAKNFRLLNRSTTPISSESTEQRIENIRIAFSKYNGKILKPKEKFSFNSIVGPRTQEKGFLEAVEYAYGELVPGFGGGVCQASTTTYLAAVQSGLKITSRVPHSDPVSYTQLGKDATVYYSKGRQIDFSFKNTTEHDIYITAKVISDPYNKKRLICEVCFYGYSEEDIRYELESVTVEVLAPPEEPIIIEDKDAKYVVYTDQEYIIQKPKEGYVVETYLSKVVNGIEVSKITISKDIYKAKPKRVYVGTTIRIN